MQKPIKKFPQCLFRLVVLPILACLLSGNYAFATSEHKAQQASTKQESSENLGSNSKLTAKVRDLQTITSISDVRGEAFGNRTNRRFVTSFAELPLSKNSSIGENSQISQIESSHNDSTKAFALNSLELFHRYKFYSNQNLGLTIQNSYKFQGIYNENKNLALMPKQDDYELRLLVAHNMTDRLVNNILANEKPYFARFEVAYRRRFNNPFDEARTRLWFGLKLNSQLSFLLQDDVAWNLIARSNSLDNGRNFNKFAISKNANNLANFSLVYRPKSFGKDAAIQFGYIKRLSGNAPFYDNDGFAIGLLNKF